MWTLLRHVVPSVWSLGRFSVFPSRPFPSGFFGLSLSFVTGGHCWTMLISSLFISDLSLSWL